MKETNHQPITVTPHLFQLGIPSFPVYLSLGEEGIIIEGGTGPTSDIIVRQVDMLGIDPSKIRYMALTHTHADHVGAVPRLRRLWPHMRVLAGPVAAAFLKKENFLKEFLPVDRMIGDLLIHRQDIMSHPSPIEAYKFDVDRIIEDGDSIDLGAGIVWHVYRTPGHSPCHMSFYEENEHTMVIGDMTGYYDHERDVFWPNYFASLGEYCNSIQRMASFPAARYLLSHNGVVEGNSGQHMQNALKATEVYHREMLRRLDQGNDWDKICAEKADWVCSLGALASQNIIRFLCKLLLKNSAAEREKADFGIAP